MCGWDHFPAVDVRSGVLHHASRHVRPFSGGHRSLHPGSGQNTRGNILILSSV